MKKLLSGFVLCLVAMSVAAPLHAADGDGKGKGKKRDPEAMLKKRDTNGDGKLSLSEMTTGAKDVAKAEERFKKMDKNSDGFLTLEEMTARRKKKD